ncbi:hypothetical protein ACFE04_007964 [Oxalis oulophora]
MAIIRLAALFVALSVNAHLISCTTGGGVIGRAKSKYSSCATNVVQQPGEINRGGAVVFNPKLDLHGPVKESSDLFIHFNAFPLCGIITPAPTIWRVGSAQIDGHYFLLTGPYGIKNRLFHIVKSVGHNNSYKIMFCPSGSSCKAVGLFIDADGLHRLGLTDTSLDVVFVKAK